MFVGATLGWSHDAPLYFVHLLRKRRLRSKLEFVHAGSPCRWHARLGTSAVSTGSPGQVDGHAPCIVRDELRHLHECTSGG